jgi:hypothetical protein
MHPEICSECSLLYLTVTWLSNPSLCCCSHKSQWHCGCIPCCFSNKWPKARAWQGKGCRGSRQLLLLPTRRLEARAVGGCGPLRLTGSDGPPRRCLCGGCGPLRLQAAAAAGRCGCGPRQLRAAATAIRRAPPGRCRCCCGHGSCASCIIAGPAA